MKTQTIMDSPIGPLTLTGDITGEEVLLDAVSFGREIHSGQSSADLAPVADRLQAYFAGRLGELDLPHTVRGTPFQRRVWAAVDAIPCGSTTSYGQLAAAIGVPRNRIRAVAAAVGANPLLIVRPCHRVIGADGSLTGYAGGLERKQFLLAHEGALRLLPVS